MLMCMCVLVFRYVYVSVDVCSYVTYVCMSVYMNMCV